MGKDHHKPLNKNNLNEKALAASKSKDKKKFLRHIYNSKKWKDIRNEYISEHPTCECCHFELATQVHHIKRFSTGKNKKEIEKLAYDKNNLMALCSHCHISKHLKNFSESVIEDS